MSSRRSMSAKTTFIRIMKVPNKARVGASKLSQKNNNPKYIDTKRTTIPPSSRKLRWWLANGRTCTCAERAINITIMALKYCGLTPYGLIAIEITAIANFRAVITSDQYQYSSRYPPTRTA